MLPTPATSRRTQLQRKDPFTSSRHTNRFRYSTLFSPSRVTNFGLVLLCGSLAVSLLFNFRTFIHHHSGRPSAAHVYELSRQTPKSILDTIERGSSLAQLEHLIVVAGHAVWKGCTPDGRLDELNWILEERQKGGGNVNAFFRHIEEGVKLLKADEHSLLVFSGGQTRPKSLLTEAQSYHQLASSSNLLTRTSSPRVTTENFALDSFQNLLFSIARFREVTGAYPKTISIVGFGMKRKRFEELHRKAIRWPGGKFAYVGIDVQGDTSVAYAGEHEFGFTPYSKDLYGCHTELMDKRRRRNPFQIHHPYHASAPELAGLLEWCPAGSHKNDIYPGSLPWDIDARSEHSNT